MQTVDTRLFFLPHGLSTRLILRVAFETYNTSHFIPTHLNTHITWYMQQVKYKCTAEHCMSWVYVHTDTRLIVCTYHIKQTMPIHIILRLLSLILALCKLPKFTWQGQQHFSFNTLCVHVLTYYRICNMQCVLCMHNCTCRHPYMPLCSIFT